MLDETISSQRSCDEKSKLGYKKTSIEKGSSSKMAGKVDDKESYESVIMDPVKKEE